MDKKVFIAIGLAIAGAVIFAGISDGELAGRSGANQARGTGLGQDVVQVAGQPGMVPWDVTGTPATPATPAMIPSIINMAATNSPQPVAQGAKQMADTYQAAREPPNFLPRDIQLSEAHWQGMDVARLTAELRQKLKYPKGLEGIMIDEVTLNSAGSGFLAGDIITHVAEVRVRTLEEFQQSSRSVRGESKATLVVLRKAERRENGRYAVRRVSLVLRGDPDLGFAQLEAAPMILPGDGRPHSHRGPCTLCHSVGKGFELTPDPDMITLPPPTLSHASVVKGISPHRDRGPCEACHLITR
jgi:hypothetical protein